MIPRDLGRTRLPARLALGAWVALLLSGLAGSAADVLVLEGGKSVRGALVARGAEEVRLNSFGCTAPEMTLGVRVFRTRDVKRVDPDEDAPWMVARLDVLLDAGGAEVVSELAALHVLARRKGLRDVGRRVAEEALARGATDPELLKTVGGAAAWAQRRRGDVRLDAALATAFGRLLVEPRGLARREQAEFLRAQAGLTLSPETIERMAQSLEQPVGVFEEQPLVWRTEETPPGTYSLRVPADVHPLEPRPLVLALHGGGVVQRPDGTAAFSGSGRDMLRLLENGAQERGWLLLCPTAVEAPWDTPRNRAFLDALLQEVAGRYNVDLARLHVIGLGAGGTGATALASTWSERFACVGSASAPVPATSSALLARRLGLWLGHGDADAVQPVEPVRKLALRLLEQGADFVYCELPKEGHGLPSSAERDWYHYAAGRRNPRATSAWPEASFERPVSDLERRARGDPAAAWGRELAADASDESLWSALIAGRADADPASQRLLLRRPADLVARALALVRDRSAPTSARRFAAGLLGEVGAVEAGEVLGDLLRAEDDPLLRLAAAGALRRLAQPESREDLRFALLDAAGRFAKASFPGGRVPFQAYERVVRLCCEVVEALALVATAEQVVEDVEGSLVLGLLKDPRPVERRGGPQGDPAELRRALARSISRAYRTLNAEPTLLEMLRTVAKRDGALLEAVAEGQRQGVRR